MLIAVGAVAMFGFVARTRLDLNSGWEYARVPEQPSIWSSADAVSRATWRLLSVDSQETASENGSATRAFDGDTKTFWHTEWSKSQAPYPHSLVVDLGSKVNVDGLRLLTRQTGAQNGRPNHYSLSLSMDGSSWPEPVISGSVPNSAELFSTHFKPTWAKFMKLVFMDGWKPEPYLALSEIGLTKNISLKDRADWNTQYNVANVQIGKSAFDLSPAQLDSVKQVELGAIKKSWQGAVLPHTPWIRPIDSAELWQGVAYYRRSLDVPAAELGRHFEFTLEAAMQDSSVWLNGKRVGGRRGGYLPVVIDLSGKIKRHNELLVRIDNRDNPLIPPGKPQQELDFIYGCGLYRNAYLTEMNPLHVTDAMLENIRAGGGIYVTYPKVSDALAVVRVRTHVRNSGDRPEGFTLTQQLVDSQGSAIELAAREPSLAGWQAEGYVQDLVVRRPRLWSPDHPNLYRLVTSLSFRGHVVDRLETRIGIRTVQVSRENGFVLNGKPISLRGTNRHQDYPWVGVALSDRAHKRDVVQMVRAGHNIVRLSHYPHAPAFMDACDELGLMNIPCIAGWQFINHDARFLDRVKQDIRELIRRDRNHPSAVLWEASLNETYPPASLAREWHDVAKSESLDGRVLTAGDGTKGAPWDVCYNSWVDADHSRPQDGVPERPGYIREYGDYEFGGSYSSTRVRIGAGLTKLLQAAWNEVWSLNRYRPQHPWTMGEGTWAMFDDNGPWEFKISAWGLSDLFRRQKPAFAFFQSQASAKPVLKVVCDWAAGAPSRDVVVFTNCDSADLYLNGIRVASAKSERGAATSYSDAKPFDGSNTANLVAPPIVFRGVKYRPGELKVIGYRGGKAAASDMSRTAGKPVRLKLWVDDLGVPVGVNDLAFVRTAFVDENGAVCPGLSPDVTVRVSGSGVLAGESKLTPEQGVASALIRTGIHAGKVRVKAVSKSGLRGSVEFTFK